MTGIIFANTIIKSWVAGDGITQGVIAGLVTVFNAMVSGAKSMAGVTAAVGAAGIIVGAVSSTGLNNAMLSVVEAISQGNFYILLPLVAVVCLILGMGLPTTANYIVVASLMATVLVELGNAAGLVIPLVAVHLYVLFFGLMADSTPPVCLAAFAASAISGAPPMRTGVQSFLYDIRTAILPLVFIFNPELLLIGITSVWHGISVFIVSLIAILTFAAVTQRWLLTRLSIIEQILLLAVVVSLFRPDAIMNRIYPEFQPVDISTLATSKTIVLTDRAIRLHITRETEYGDRFKLFVIPAIKSGGKNEMTLDLRTGITLSPDTDGRFTVSDTQFNGIGEKAGIRLGDIATAVDVKQVDRPAKEWVFPFGFLLLGLVLYFQLLKSRRPQSPVTQPGGA
jgi:TRAP-type uncharacterized transport system fused permease subunit